MLLLGFRASGRNKIERTRVWVVGCAVWGLRQKAHIM